MRDSTSLRLKRAVVVTALFAIWHASSSFADTSMAADVVDKPTAIQLLDSGNVVVCESLGALKCTDSALEAFAKDRWCKAGLLSTSVFLLANKSSGNVWAIRLIGNQEDSAGCATLEVSSLRVSDGVDEDWMNFVTGAFSERGAR